MEKFTSFWSTTNEIAKLKDKKLDPNHFTLLAGNSHPELVKGISIYLGIPIANMVVDRFANGEIRVQINENIRCKHAIIIQTGVSLNSPYNSINDILMELLIIANACKLSSAKSITALVPNYFYARQDKKDVSRSPISGRLIADLLKTAGITRLVCLDLHAAQIAGFFDIPVDNLYAINLLATDIITNYLQDKSTKKTVFASSTFAKSASESASKSALESASESVSESVSEYILVSPDAGGVKRMNALASKVKLKTAMMHKTRNHEGKNEVLNTILVGEEIKNKICLIVDDICDTAGTVIKASQTLIEHGAKSIILIMVHGILSGPAIDRINGMESIREVVVTNSLPQTENQKLCPKLRVVDISALLGETVRRLYTGESISSIFN